MLTMKNSETKEHFFASKFKGVTKGRIRQKDGVQMWPVQIRLGDNVIPLGAYEDEVSAAIAFNEAVIISGKKSRLNSVLRPEKFQFAVKEPKKLLKLLRACRKIIT